MNYRICNLTIALGMIAAPFTWAQDNSRVDILVSPSGSGPYLAWATFQNYAPDHSDTISPVAVETPGFVYNVRYMAESPDLWENTIFGSGQIVEWAAGDGVAPFFPEPLEAAQDFQVLGVMSQTSNFFVALDEATQSTADFADKRVATGLLTQNEWGMHHRLVLDELGLTDQLASFNALGPNENINALIDGQADIGAIVLHSAKDFKENLEPAPFRTLESSGRDWHLIDIPESDLRQIIDSTGAPIMVRDVPGGTISGQPEGVTTFGNFMTLSAHRDFPEEKAYEVVKLWLEVGESIGEYSAIAEVWDPESISEMARLFPEKIHPGAMRAYEEAGLID